MHKRPSGYELDMNNMNIFIENRMKDICNALISNNIELGGLIGEINDLFLSPYRRTMIADEHIIQSLWVFLFEIFIRSNDNNVKFNVVCTMCDVYIYQSNLGFELSLKKIKEWRGGALAKSSSQEIIECIDDILSM